MLFTGVGVQNLNISELDLLISTRLGGQYISVGPEKVHDSQLFLEQIHLLSSS